MKVISVVSLWEIQIKSQLGKLTLNQPLEKIYQSQSQNGISFLAVNPGCGQNPLILPGSFAGTAELVFPTESAATLVAASAGEDPESPELDSLKISKLK
ncbi:MAG: hypothetical protein GDA48_19620 [Hormoscilla sp. GM102CHS1]|nr:hypothetical protein [Hormoscilla sp. GM102CHS1]